MSEIDIVLPWVDGSDPAWQACKQQYSNKTGDARDIRFRDWELLKYIFRGIDNNLPWIRKVHFITWGHLPDWLNTNCPKLNIVKHTDYIPEEWLPTFSANPIELNIHRISGLSEEFIYMNDDMFFVKPLKPENFFLGGKPVSQAGLNIMNNEDNVFTGILYSDLDVINRHFFSRTCIPGTILKFINPHYGLKENLKTLSILPWCVGYYPGFSISHGPNAYLKKTFEELWKKEYKALSETSSHKFRTFEDINQYVFLWWQWCKGDFVPRNMKKQNNYLSVKKPLNTLCAEIEKPSYQILCFNDAEIDDFEEKKEALAASFEKLFSSKSIFEL